jgi:transposase
MPRTRTPYPADFRDQIIALAGAGRSVESLAREFEPCAATVAGWVRQAGIDGGARIDGPTSPEREELRRLRRPTAVAQHLDRLFGQALRVKPDHSVGAGQ